MGCMVNCINIGKHHTLRKRNISVPWTSRWEDDKGLIGSPTLQQARGKSHGRRRNNACSLICCSVAVADGDSALGIIPPPQVLPVCLGMDRSNQCQLSINLEREKRRRNPLQHYSGISEFSLSCQHETALVPNNWFALATEQILSPVFLLDLLLSQRDWGISALDVAFHWLIFLQRNIIDQADITEMTIRNSWCSNNTLLRETWRRDLMTGYPRVRAMNIRPIWGGMELRGSRSQDRSQNWPVLQAMQIIWWYVFPWWRFATHWFHQKIKEFPPFISKNRRLSWNQIRLFQWPGKHQKCLKHEKVRRYLPNLMQP